MAFSSDTIMFTTSVSIISFYLRNVVSHLIFTGYNISARSRWWRGYRLGSKRRQRREISESDGWLSHLFKIWLQFTGFQYHACGNHFPTWWVAARYSARTSRTHTGSKQWSLLCTLSALRNTSYDIRNVLRYPNPRRFGTITVQGRRIMGVVNILARSR